MEVQATIALAVVVVVALLVTKGRSRVHLKGPLGTALGIEEDGVRAVDVRDVQAGRDVALRDDTGRGVRANGVTAGQDVHVRVRMPRRRDTGE